MIVNLRQIDRQVSGHPWRPLIFIGLFGIAMGFLEAVVVVYLRGIYYPGGFGFPLSPVSPRMYVIELVRELATLVMLLSVAAVAGRDFIHKFAYFLYSFALWDLFYYGALKLMLNWPSSLLTWDVLFLIPLPWIGPVIAPMLTSLTMLLLAGLLFWLEEINDGVRLSRLEWAGILSGALLIFASFIWSYFILLIQEGHLMRILTQVHDKAFLERMYAFRPRLFNWYLYGCGELLELLTMILLVRRRYRWTKNHERPNL